MGVLELAREAGVLKVGTASTDGTKLRANASINQKVTYERAGELTAALQTEVRELLEQAERADQDNRDDGQKLPDELARREALKAKLEQARERLEQRAKQRAEAERSEYERKIEARAQPNRRRAEPKVLKAPLFLAMKAKLETDAGRKLYALRKQTVEPVFGIIESVMGFRPFLLRGLAKVSGEWALITLAYNGKRFWTLKLALD